MLCPSDHRTHPAESKIFSRLKENTVTTINNPEIPLLCRLQAFPCRSLCLDAPSPSCPPQAGLGPPPHGTSLETCDREPAGDA